MIKFGTSGFRGIIGDNWTKQNIQKIGAAFRQTVKGPVKIVIGYDNRFMGKENAQWLCEAVCCEDIYACVYSAPVPSPVIARCAVEDFDYGIMLTASHNPFYYNGIKVFLRGGKEADDAFFAKISKALESIKRVEAMPFSDIIAGGFAQWRDGTTDYVDKVVSLLDTKKIAESDIKVLFNPMHGSSADVVEQIFSRLGIVHQTMNGNADPCFGGLVPAPYSYNLKAQAKAVVKNKFNFGFALDGDGDRVTFIDSDGKIFDCNYLLAVFYYYYIEIKKRKGSIVKNFLSSNLTARMCKKYGYSVTETRVGFKFLGAALEGGDALMAGEATGIAFKDISLSKDGIFAAFALIDILVSTKKSIGRIVEEITDALDFPTRYVEYAYEFEPRERESVERKLLGDEVPSFDANVERIERHPDGVKIVFEGEYWAAARLSGTESVVRFYAESATEKEAEAIISGLENFYNLHNRQK